MVELNNIYLQDCIEGMKGIPDNSIDIVIADPPYNVSKGGNWSWNNEKRLTGFGGKWNKVMEAWDDMPLNDLFLFTVNWISEVKRIVKPTGSIWVFGTYHNIGVINFALQNLEIEIINEVIWFKRNSFPNLSGRRLTASHENILWAHTGGSSNREYFFNYEMSKNHDYSGDLIKQPLKQMRTVWDIPNNKKKEELLFGKHPTQKGEKVIDRMIRLSAKAGDTLLTPFSGAGTECVVAKKLGLNYIGFEIEEEYVEIGKKRLDNIEFGKIELNEAVLPKETSKKQSQKATGRRKENKKEEKVKFAIEEVNEGVQASFEFAEVQNIDIYKEDYDKDIIVKQIKEEEFDNSPVLNFKKNEFPLLKQENNKKESGEKSFMNTIGVEQKFGLEKEKSLINITIDRDLEKYTITDKESIPSLIKWTGSKRKQADEIFNEFPGEYDRYIEPFVGGGALLYLAANNNAIANDLYKPLVEFWNMVKNTPEDLIEYYTEEWNELQSNFPDHFYEVRKRFNANPNGKDLSFLTRTCVNGIVRFNKVGEFNNSIHLSRRGMKPDNLKNIVKKWNRKIQGVEFTNFDYREILDKTKKGDLVYLDPPYAGSSNRYIADLDIEVFFEELEKLNSKGVKWILSFDGKRGETDLEYPVPQELYKSKKFLSNGKSTLNQVLNGKSLDVLEALYKNF